MAKLRKCKYLYLVPVLVPYRYHRNVYTCYVTQHVCSPVSCLVHHHYEAVTSYIDLALQLSYLKQAFAPGFTVEAGEKRRYFYCMTVALFHDWFQSNVYLHLNAHFTMLFSNCGDVNTCFLWDKQFLRLLNHQKIFSLPSANVFESDDDKLISAKGIVKPNAGSLCGRWNPIWVSWSITSVSTVAIIVAVAVIEVDV